MSRSGRYVLSEASPSEAGLYECVAENGVGVAATRQLNVNVLCRQFFLLTCRLVTFCVSRGRRKMYCGHARARLCVCLSVCLSAAACPYYCTDPDVTWGRGRGCPIVVHYWADLQSVHGLCCYGNITRNLVYAGCMRALLISDRRVTGAFSTLRAVYRKCTWLAGR